jgi:2-polyprenyl-6-methoxyphenol hydroxylase-like FAD-dependent oxidoreductase
MLTPNSLPLLDSWGVYKRIQTKGFNFDAIIAKDDLNRTTDTWRIGGEQLYGYQAIRIYRHVLVEVLLAVVKERGIPVIFEKKFTRVVSESDTGVVFEFTDGSSEMASLLIGADGIHSKVRQYVSPSVHPVYTGALAIACAVRKSNLRFPNDVDYPLPASIHGKNGFFLLTPQTFDGEELIAGTQRSFPAQAREGWEKLASDKVELLKLMRHNMQDWSDIVQSALENVDEDTFYIWPYHAVPRLDNWTSPDRRVILLGDAAHAIPPTFGQGANQAFEDAFTLALLLSKLGPQVQLQDALGFWQSFRQERIDKIIELTNMMNKRRLPAAERERLAENEREESSKNPGAGGRLRWLYSPHLEEEVLSWVDNQSKLGNEDHLKVVELQVASKLAKNGLV